jgi:putative ABC transport system ATP-binding protein
MCPKGDSRDTARARVDSSPFLKPHHYVLVDYPWPEGDKHFLWVVTARERELIDWAADAERILLRHVQRASAQIPRREEALMSRKPHLVTLTDVSKAYVTGANEPALNGVSVQIDAGEFTAIMGPSGSGKSTLLNLIAGLDRPTSGSILVDGHKLSGMSEAALARYRRELVGVIFQFFNLLTTLTVLENVLIPAQLAGMKRREANARARELLERLGLAGKEQEVPGKLSGGQQQRVAIARALINRPRVLLADEPTGALDSHNGEQVMDLLSELNRGGQTLILVSHDPGLAARYASRIISLRDGRVERDECLRPRAGVVPFAAKQAEPAGVDS